MKKTIHTKSYKQLLIWLKTSRKQQGLTIRQFAKQISVHHSIVWNIENAERRLDVMEYVQYCQQLGIDPIIGIKILIEN